MILDGIELVRQTSDYDCGESCVTCVLRYWGIWNYRRTHREGLLTNSIDGTDPRAIETYLRRCGLKVFSGTFDEALLRNTIGTGKPVIVCVQNHWVVAYGLRYRSVYLMDPLAGLCKENWCRFFAQWADVDRLGAELQQWGISAWK